MVLCRKKLRKKFRSLLAESLTANESKDLRKMSSSATDIGTELQIVRELLKTKSRRIKLLNRENKGDEKDLVEEDSKNGDVDNQDTVDLIKEKGSNKKRKKRRETKLRKKGNEGLEGNVEKFIGDENGASNILQVVDESEAKKVYVGGIPYYSSEDDIRSFFEDCGTVTEMDCMTFSDTGKFRGIAILSFKTEGAAKRALALDGSDMGGFSLKIQPYKSNRNPKSDFTPDTIDGYNRVYVGNLSWDISEDDLKQFFSDCKITSIRFGTDKETADFKGYAHVDFADSISLTIALKLDQKVVCGRPVKVRCAVPRKSGQTEISSKSFCDKKQESNKVGDESCAGKSKKKRRTCYECGTPGHLSSDCPQKGVPAS